MVETIKAGERRLNDVFCDNFEFEIPPYQRPYAWGTSEAETLLDDLLNACEGTGNIAELAPYFLGSIVVIKSHESPISEVIDGQQRLTTLTILFSVLRDLLEGPAHNSADRLVRQQGDFAAGTRDTYRLTVRARDSDFFRAHIQKGKEYAGGGLKDARKNMIENFRALKARLESMPEEIRGRLLQFAAQRCFLVIVEASDRASAYRVFSVMNNRGLDLTATDILKAGVVGAIDENEQDAYNKKWEDIEEALGREAFGDLFAHIRMIHQKTKLRATLEHEFRQVVKPAERPQQFIDEELRASADAYKVILSRTFESPEHGENIKRLLGGLALLDNNDWQPPAIKFIADKQDDPAAISVFLRRLDRLAFSMFIRRADINTRINRYAAILRGMEREEDISAEGLLGLSGAEKADTLTTLGGNIYEVTKICRQVLLRLDEALSDGSATYDFPVISIEHVLPQNPDPTGPWITAFPNEEDRINWTHRLGNLVLLSRHKNSSASNWGFEEKKEKYFTVSKSKKVSGSKAGATPFALTSQVLAQPLWTCEVVAKRQQECLDALKNLWDLNA